jgi:nitrite reductase/ring-hydroxylating ferredoxin subunit
MTRRVPIGPSERLPDGGRLVLDVDDMTIGIFRVGGRLYAYENRCPHQGGPVCQGTMLPGVVEVLDAASVSTGFAFDDADARIVCPWHGYEFRITTGSHPARQSIRLRAVAVHEENGLMYVEL